MGGKGDDEIISLGGIVYKDFKLHYYLNLHIFYTTTRWARDYVIILFSISLLLFVHATSPAFIDFEAFRISISSGIDFSSRACVMLLTQISNITKRQKSHITMHIRISYRLLPCADR